MPSLQNTAIILDGTEIDVLKDGTEVELDGAAAELGQLINPWSMLRISQSGEKGGQKEGRAVS